MQIPKHFQLYGNGSCSAQRQSRVGRRGKPLAGKPSAAGGISSGAVQEIVRSRQCTDAFAIV